MAGLWSKLQPTPMSWDEVLYECSTLYIKRSWVSCETKRLSQPTAKPAILGLKHLGNCINTWLLPFTLSQRHKSHYNQGSDSNHMHWPQWRPCQYGPCASLTCSCRDCPHIKLPIGQCQMMNCLKCTKKRCKISIFCTIWKLSAPQQSWFAVSIQDRESQQLRIWGFFNAGHHNTCLGSPVE